MKSALRIGAVFCVCLLLGAAQFSRMRTTLVETNENRARDLPTTKGNAGKGDAAESASDKSAPIRATDAQLAAAGVNEAGDIPILEYHEISDGKSRMCRTANAFRHDLARLYAENYRPVLISNYIDNRIDIPLGASPVVLTFDDARASQFHYLKDGTIDPECAVGILQEFAKLHPDFPVKATFFVLPENAFGSKPDIAARKINALLAMGCEVQNHTVTHRYFNRLSDEEVRKEIAMGAAMIERMAPEAKVDILALPGGIMPANRSLLPSGDYHGVRYSNRGVILAAGNPSRSPAVRKFNPYFVPRIEAIEDKDGIVRWLDWLKANPKRRYISDGDPRTMTVPKASAALVDANKLHDAALRTY